MPCHIQPTLQIAEPSKSLFRAEHCREFHKSQAISPGFQMPVNDDNEKESQNETSYMGTVVFHVSRSLTISTSSAARLWLSVTSASR